MELFHYTDTHGLMGIINSRALWATDINFLNDSDEFHAGVKTLTAFCQTEAATTAQSADPVMQAATKLYEILPGIIQSNLTNRGPVHHLVFQSGRQPAAMDVLLPAERGVLPGVRQ